MVQTLRQLRIARRESLEHFTIFLVGPVEKGTDEWTVVWPYLLEDVLSFRPMKMNSSNAPNQSVELTATRCAFTFFHD